jgi:ElaB/YqjD/DUF883 family membrane-anchored ribosome-binding protein
MNLQELQLFFEQKKGQCLQLEEELSKVKSEQAECVEKQRICEQALATVRAVALETQRQLEFQIEAIVNAAEEAVFDDPYKLVVKFEEKRGKPECLLAFEREGMLLDPLSSAGYGAVDVAAFALRAACWAISRQTRPLFILDEPFKHLKGVEQNRRVIEMVREISKELGIQVVMISDERAPKEDILEGADAVFEVTKSNGKSEVARL